MKLNELMNEAGFPGNYPETEISFVTDNSDEVTKDSLFVAVEGRNGDGHEKTAQAFEKGAATAVTEKHTGCPFEITVPDSRRAYGFLCSAFYGHPEREMIFTGITGTNGKTSTASHLSHILNVNGMRCGTVGTLGVSGAENAGEPGYTTPGGHTLFSALRDMADAGCSRCVMEVSSQALAQSRTDAIGFGIGILTNIGRDHLDYHGKMKNYVEAKSRLFTMSEKALLNSDDAYAEQIAALAGLKDYATYSAKGRRADFMARDVRRIGGGTEFLLLHGTHAAQIRLESPFVFEVYNALAAFGGAVIAGVGFYEAAQALCSLPPVRGRMQKIGCAGFDVYVDFAHTPEALSAALRSLRDMTAGRLITVFGCGGERDRLKRPEMGAAAARYSDTVILTDDNPRGEDPARIIADIRSGIKSGTDVFVQRDRGKAIGLALNKASAGDTVLIAGKGHEEYILTKNGKEYFSDAQTVAALTGNAG